MTRLEEIKQLIENGNEDDLGEYLCVQLELTGMDCDVCPLSDRCSEMGNGFYEWLRKEAMHV